MFSRATNFNAPIGNWDMTSAEFMEGMFEAAVSFNQNVSAWDVSSAISVERMFANAAELDQSICWTALGDDVLTSDLFCGSHPGAHFDPCCVDATVIETACRCTSTTATSRQSGSCDTFCPSPLTPTQTPVSNDPPRVEDEDSDMQEEPSFGDDAVVGETEDTTSAPNTNTQNTTTTAIEDNASPETSKNDNGDKDESESPWEGYVWLRVLVYVLLLLVVGGIFVYYLQLMQRAQRRRRAEQAALSTADGSTAAANGTAPVKATVLTNSTARQAAESYDDEEVGTVQTKPTDEDNVVTTASGDSEK